jgi:hypothetical protein
MTRSGHAPRLPTTLLARADEVIKMSQGTAGVPEGVLLESNGISRDLTPSGLKRAAAPALKRRRTDEICQDLTDRRRDHNPRVGGSSPSSATNFAL